MPTTDPFSRIGQEEQIPWVAYSWLHEVGLYGAYGVGGFAGVLAVRHGLDSATFLAFAWFILRGSGGRITAVAALTLATGALVPLMLERPWHYTIVFTVLTLHAILELRAGAPARRFWWLTIVYALWANLHIQFVLGLGLLGLSLAIAMIENWRRGGSRFALSGWLGLLVGCALATLVNPYSFRLYQVVFEYATQTAAMRVVSELAPPDFGFWWNWLLIALLIWAVGVCGLRGFPLFDTALLVVGAVFSLRMQRDIWFGALIAATVITRLPATRGPTETRSLLPGLIAATLLALVLARVVWQIGPGANKTIDSVNRAEYPAGAVEYLRKHHPPGPIYNHFNWGGYLIWALPEYPVSMDGRTNLYGEDRLQRAYAVWNGEPGWFRDQDVLRSAIILAPKKLGNEKVVLAELLRAELLRAKKEIWQAVYEDATSIVFVVDIDDGMGSHR
ncbi:MAG TPA: hypothetical protein VHR66_25225 [Gemmataceae bacterium]|nr:hypothetical protein [Gemmataceae bacterium]